MSSHWFDRFRDGRNDADPRVRERYETRAERIAGSRLNAIRDPETEFTIGDPAVETARQINEFRSRVQAVELERRVRDGDPTGFDPVLEAEALLRGESDG